ncbi:hypothetical protein [Streptomyces seoulensis]|uniref:hypothetical protein n=1 Tax=Streptomyces seoulensis TaxID=73044 RepID=UPI001FCB05CD|nr:hypothetical protein [Streptomyces seoulensis]BDH05542.1 hypothetical protein HEK131_27690 [Streptomyces seoulensis]
MEVRNRAHHQVACHLVHFSRHKDGLWLFGEAASLAQVEWRRACVPPARSDTLIDTFEDEEQERKTQWIKRIKKNVEDLLGQHDSFVVDHHQAEVMAGVLGQARALHVRAAIQELYKSGKNACNGVGDVRQLRVTRAP